MSARPDRVAIGRVVELLSAAIPAQARSDDAFTLTRGAKLVMLRNQAALADDIASFERAVRTELRAASRWQSAARGTVSALEDALAYAAAARREN